MAEASHFKEVYHMVNRDGSKFKMNNKMRKPTKPRCTGQIKNRYCQYCSQGCPLTFICVTISMGEYLRSGKIVMSSGESINEP